MKRYITRPKHWEGEWYNEPGPQPLTMTVWETDKAPQKSGLLDKNGNVLYAVKDSTPIGFVRFVK